MRADDHYSPEDMHASLEELAVNEELTFEKIPSVKTIKGWIGRYSANFKKEASEKALLKNNSNILAFEETSSKCQKIGRI